MKYSPAWPDRPFESLEAARAWVLLGFVTWYNRSHRHSAVMYVTLNERHEDLDKALLARRKAAYEAARRWHPERWSGGIRNWEAVEAV